MGVSDAIFNMIFNILSIYACVRGMELFLVPRHREWNIALPFYIGVWLVTSLSYVLGAGIRLTNLSFVLGFMTLAFFLYEGSWKRKALAALTVMGTVIVLEDIVWVISSIMGSPVENVALGCLRSGILELFFVALIEKLLSLHRYAAFPLNGYVSISILSVGSMILAEIITEEVGSYELSMTALSIICIVNISTYHIYHKIAENYKKDMHRAALLQENQMYAKQLELLQQSQQHARILRHDMKNHMLLLGAYLEKGEYGKAREYADSLAECPRTVQEYVRTGNMGVDSLLNYKLDMICRHTGCIPQLSVGIPGEPFMPEADLNIILGNLLDNAAEGIEGADEKYLDLQMRYERNVLYISIYNSYDGQVELDKNGRFRTRKVRKEGHGIGLESVEFVLKKYGGKLMISHENCIFKADLMLYAQAAAREEKELP